MSEGSLASAYVLYPFQALVQGLWNGGQSLKDQREGWSCSWSRTLENESWEENLFDIWTEVSTWQVQGIYTKVAE